jgi:phosphatidylglycerophosphatase A
MKKHLALIFATAGYVGMIPGAPGTYGSVVAVVAFATIHRLGGRIIPELHISACCLVTAVGLLAAAQVSRDLGVEDPKIVVIDEVAGQLVSFLFLPVTWRNLVFGFALFRFFDIKKPLGIRQVEQLPAGIGVMADDLLAGAYANLVLQVVGRLL